MFWENSHSFIIVLFFGMQSKFLECSPSFFTNLCINSLHYSLLFWLKPLYFSLLKLLSPHYYIPSTHHISIWLDPINVASGAQGLLGVGINDMSWVTHLLLFLKLVSDIISAWLWTLSGVHSKSMIEFGSWSSSSD